MLGNIIRGIFISMSILFVTTACVAGDKVTNPPKDSSLPEDEQGKLTKQPQEENEKKTKDDKATPESAATPYAFKEFDLDVDHDGKEDVIEVDYDHEENEVESSYSDQLQDINLKGKKALEKLDPIFADFNIDESTADDEVLDLVIETFDIPDNARIELSIEYTNGVEKEYRR